MSNINDFVRPTSNIDRRDINKILELIHDLVAASPEDEGAQERITHASHLKTRTTTVTFGGATRLGSTFRDKETFANRRKPPTSITSYPLIHTSNNFSGITFPSLDTKFGGRIEWDGTGYITVADQARLKPTNKITLIGWFYLIKNTTLQELVKIQNTNPAYEIRIRTDDSIRFRVRVGAINHNIDILTGSWTANAWNHLTLTWSGSPDNRFRVYLNKVQQGADITTSGALTYSGTDGLGIAAQPNGGNLLANLSRMSLLSILNTEYTQTNIDNHFDGLLDTSDGNDEILSLNFIGDENPTPDETSGLCKSVV